jgi:hypothetical protein
MFIPAGADVHLFRPWELIKGTSAKGSTREEPWKLEYFAKFCRTRYFEFLNSILTKTFETNSNFFRIFISKF